MKQREYRYFMGDFETTVYKGQVNTEVWASALVELFSDKVTILHSIAETFDYLVSLNCNVVVYYHNLKFDGAFWLSYLLVDKKFTAYQGYDQKIKQGTYLNDKVVIDGNIVTSRGPATAYAFAYKLVDLLGGDSLEVKKRMVYFNAFDVKEDE